MVDGKSKSLRAGRGSPQTAVVDGTTLGDMGQDTPALSSAESPGGQVNVPGMRADGNQIPGPASIGYTNDPATMGAVNVAAMAQYPQQLSSQTQYFGQQGIPNQVVMAQPQMAVSHSQPFSVLQRQEQSLLEPMQSLLNTVLGQQQALQASMQEQSTLAAQAKGLETQLADAEQQASQSRQGRQAAASSSGSLRKSSRFRRRDDDDDDPKLTLNEDKMGESMKNLILIGCALGMIGFMILLYRFSETYGQYLQPYSPVSEYKKQELWEKSRRRALQLFGGWPAAPADSPHGLGIPGPPPNPATIFKSPGETPNLAWQNTSSAHGDTEVNRTSTYTRASYNVALDSQTYSWYVNIMWDVIYRNEINLFRAERLKKRTNAITYVSMISQTTVFTLIPLQGSLGSDLVDNMLKVVMMVMSLCGVFLRGVEEAFQLKAQSDNMMQMAIKQEELYQTLATRQDEFAQFFEPDSDDEVSDCVPDAARDPFADRKFNNGFITFTPDMYFAAMNHFLDKYEVERHKANAAMMKAAGGSLKKKGKKTGGHSPPHVAAGQRTTGGAAPEEA